MMNERDTTVDHMRLWGITNIMNWAILQFWSNRIRCVFHMRFRIQVNRMLQFNYFHFCVQWMPPKLLRNMFHVCQTLLLSFPKKAVNEQGIKVLWRPEREHSCGMPCAHIHKIWSQQVTYVAYCQNNGNVTFSACALQHRSVNEIQVHGCCRPFRRGWWDFLVNVFLLFPIYWFLLLLWLIYELHNTKKSVIFVQIEKNRVSRRKESTHCDVDIKKIWISP